MSPLTILVVDDHDQVRTLTVRMLEMLGHKALPAATAAEAERLNAEHPAIDLALVDMVLPDGDGMSLAQRLAARRSSLYILFVSGYGDESLSDVLAMPRRGFLGKPFSLGGLEKALARVSEELDRSAPPPG